MTAVILAAVVGALFALGTFLLLRRDLIRVVWGLAIISQAANVYLLAMGGLAEGTADSVPILAGHGDHVPQTADPLVQALVLTAIVIGFGMTAFALVLSYRVYEEHDTLDVSDLGDRE
ncbi:NADH-quinone oxidoreductase subunit K [Haloterrigena sp. SYSU A558-1]|uniref:NADH-quinone oxidoreductase subunit K n=1 Tax=Haloterrigena gelatinilytica TaxID=2741724 RepID=A0A8J8GS50_9EURY|nr:sodium:proton antiporter [Haloterrigena gelatinilytica]NUB92972.1 NADH-quinone oxidoreductase subunit K [Haloterrigena gelatinilytica]NUC71114.1 NADH-quinone oxidoreductase subunit K [Haloterrigena gelatinilytica]